MLDWNNVPIRTTSELDSINPCVRLYGAGPDDKQCKDCVHLYTFHQSARWFKCDQRPRHRKGISGDHRVRWPACAKYQKVEGPSDE